MILTKGAWLIILSSEFNMGLMRIELPIIPMRVMNVRMMINPKPGILKPIQSVRYWISNPSINSSETTMAYIVMANGERSNSP